MPANVQSMFYTGEMPWHKEGIPLKNPPNTEKAIQDAGLDWNVKKVELFSQQGNLVNNYYGIMREDNKQVLGVVKNGYLPLQNNEAFKFFDPLISNSLLEYETAGAIGNGEIVWILAKLKDEPRFEVVNGDSIDKYLLLSNSHDGQSAISIKFTPIRVVCQNTLNIALNQGDTTRIKHITSMHQKLEEVQIAVENIIRVYSNIEENFRRMVKKKLNDKKVKEYYNKLYPVIDLSQVKTQAQYTARQSNICINNQLFEKFDNGYGVKDLKIGGTLWAAYNAVTELIDHPNDYKLGDNKLLKRIWFGDGEVIKKKAYIIACDHIKVA